MCLHISDNIVTHDYRMFVFVTFCNVVTFFLAFQWQCLLCFHEDLNSLAVWKAEWQIKFNVAKCHSMRATWYCLHKHILMITHYTSKP